MHSSIVIPRKADLKKRDRPLLFTSYTNYNGKSGVAGALAGKAQDGTTTHRISTKLPYPFDNDDLFNYRL